MDVSSRGKRYGLKINSPKLGYKSRMENWKRKTHFFFIGLICLINASGTHSSINASNLLKLNYLFREWDKNDWSRWNNLGLILALLTEWRYHQWFFPSCVIYFKNYLRLLNTHTHTHTHTYMYRASQVSLVVRNPPANVGHVRDGGLIPGSGKSPGGGHGNSLQYSCLKNPMDRGAWRDTAHRVEKSWTWLERLSTHAYMYYFTKECACKPAMLIK